MSSQHGSTNLERQIRSQPDALEGIISSQTVREQVHVAAEGIQRSHRIWIVGTGTSQHAATLGALMLQEAGRSAHAVSSMQFVKQAPIVGAQDSVIVISHTLETAYALAARALAFQAGLKGIMVTKKNSGFPDAIETVDPETSETYTVSYTAALLVLGMLAAQIGASAFTSDKLALVPGSVRNAIEDPGIDNTPIPRRAITIYGAGPTAVTAREGALKLREAARFIAEGYDAEYLLHGSAVPLSENDHLVALTTPDEDGFVDAIAKTAGAEGIGVTRLSEPSPLPVLLAQVPLTAKLQLLALRFALAREQDPDKVIVGHWDDPQLWSIGLPPS